MFATYCTLQSVFSRVEYKHHGFLLIFLANYRIIFKSFFPLSSISAFLILHPLSVQILCLLHPLKTNHPCFALGRSQCRKRFLWNKYDLPLMFYVSKVKDDILSLVFGDLMAVSMICWVCLAPIRLQCGLQ